MNLYLNITCCFSFRTVFKGGHHKLFLWGWIQLVLLKILSHAREIVRPIFQVQITHSYYFACPSISSQIFRRIPSQFEETFCTLLLNFYLINFLHSQSTYSASLPLYMVNILMSSSPIPLFSEHWEYHSFLFLFSKGNVTELRLPGMIVRQYWFWQTNITIKFFDHDVF